MRTESRISHAPTRKKASDEIRICVAERNGGGGGGEDEGDDAGEGDGVCTDEADDGESRGGGGTAESRAESASSLAE